MSIERWALNTSNGNPALVRCIRGEIEKHGPQSFAWFMHQALYHPEHGYYSSGRCAIGRKGDYFTNVSVGPLFGQLLTAQFSEIWERLGKPARRGDIEDFVIVEQGAHDGQFARDVLEFAQTCLPEFFEALRYRIVEPFRVLEERQRQTLEAFPAKVEWCNALQPFTGVHFSNELLDAMPVRLISDGAEKLVGLNGDKFVFVQGAAVSKSPREHPPGDHAALDWIDSVSRNLVRGYVLIIDYGHAQRESQATIQVRSKHRNLDSPFEQIGVADITMRVDWRSIVQRAEANGLRIAGFTDQNHFLTGIVSAIGRGGSPAFAWLRRGMPESPPRDWAQSPLDSRKAKRELQTLMHPEMLGRAFQVLALAKKVDLEVSPLEGFKFAREKVTPASIARSPG